MNNLYNEIPVLDLNDFRSSDLKLKEKFIEELGKAYSDIGFVAFRNHNLSEDLQKELYGSSKEFFYSDDKIKQQYEYPELAGQRGYIGKGKEVAKGYVKPDLKEFFQIGNTKYGENLFPSEIKDFEKNTLEAFSILQKTGLEILSAIALYLNFEEDHFVPMCGEGNSILRLLHYFPIEEPEKVIGSVRASAHGDINFITLLIGASADGLEVLRRDGVWIPVTKVQDCVVVNIGDMLERYTNSKLKSTIHRVVNPVNLEDMKKSRFSIPFFLHADPAVSIASHPSCYSEENPKLFEDITVGEFLDERLKDLGLLKV
jgi:isopenicillin N synthase-like dioxygenase